MHPTADTLAFKYLNLAPRRLLSSGAGGLHRTAIRQCSPPAETLEVVMKKTTLSTKLRFILMMFLTLTISVSIYAQRNNSNPRSLGEQWIKTENYILYASNDSRDQCSEYIPKFVLVYEVAPNHVFEPDGFIKLAETIVEPKCKRIALTKDQIITFNVYLKDVRVGENDGVYTINGTTESDEVPLLKAQVYRNRYTNFQWRVDSDMYSPLRDYDKPWSLETLARKIEKSKRHLEESKIREEQARLAAEKYKAEAPQREAEEARKRIINERNLSAPVLTLIKPNAPKTYNFAGYSNQKVLEAIYNGEFDRFISRKEVDDAVFAAERARSNRDPRLAFEMLANMIASGNELAIVIARYRELASYYFGYHNAYYELCKTNKEIPWVQGSVYKFWLTSDGKVVEGSERYGYSGPIRFPYEETHKRTYELLADRLQTNPQISEETLADFRNFLQTEGCSSPTVREFEANLYLVTNMRLPLQVLYDPLLIKPAVKQNVESEPKAESPAETKKPQPAVKKAKPAVKKKQAKPPAKKDPFKGVVIPGRY
jgi:hypothetical protein